MTRRQDTPVHAVAVEVAAPSAPDDDWCVVSEAESDGESDGAVEREGAPAIDAPGSEERGGAEADTRSAGSASDAEAGFDMFGCARAALRLPNPQPARNRGARPTGMLLRSDDAALDGLETLDASAAAPDGVVPMSAVMPPRRAKAHAQKPPPPALPVRRYLPARSCAVQP